MTRNTKLAKKITALFLVLLLSIDSLAAVVSDNDGAAFVTKAEFEALKENFDKQIDEYNKSIDYKIDGAIASYLAGIKLTTNYQLDMCSSKIVYPLTFAMKNKSLDWTKWNTNGATPYWAPNYKFYIWGRRGSCYFLVDKSFSDTPAIDRFYNGKWVSDKFKISEMWSNVSGILTLKTMFYNFITQHAGESNVTFGFVTDQSSGYSRQAVGSSSFTRDKVKESGTTLSEFFSGNGTYDMFIEAIWTWGYKQALQLSSSGTSNEKYLDTFTPVSGGGWLEGNNPNQKTFSSSLSYNPQDISFVMNAYDTDRTDATGKRIELPVAYDGHIYLTNKNNFKKDLQSGTIAALSYKNGYYIFYSGYGKQPSDLYTTQWWFGNMLSPGWTLEPQFSAYTSHDIHKRSLMEPQNMYYDVKTPYTLNTYEQRLTDGILLTEADRNLSRLQISFNISSDDATVKKYLILSKNPISQMDYTQIDTEATSDPKKYYKIYSDKNMLDGTEVNKYELSEGINTIYLKDIQKNDLVYYKILWLKSNNTQCKVLSAPELTATDE